MKLLLIEDEERIAHFVLRGLMAEGHQVSWEHNGRAGFERALGEAFDVIILDLMLPGMEGRDVCRELRAAGIKTKILMLTAMETTADLVKGFGAGADDYMTKPFAFEELNARLLALGRRSDVAIATNILESGGLRFDRDALVVTFDGTRLDLTSLEYALLEFLMKEKGKVVSRARILQNVWGTVEDPLTNVVDVYIRRLRTHLAAFGADKMIVTVRGRGYRLQELESEPGLISR
ncbi:response regulator transcription factor [Marivita sp.]|uniref:response regulator transcription factor n=1 Tax=Marivita sp. TaxID=2003365 RepID=UPI0026068F30|nr:response regulator transcription factor [Marivita sp.]